MDLLKRKNKLLFFIIAIVPVFFNRTILNAFFVPQAAFFVLAVTIVFWLAHKKKYFFNADEIAMMLLFFVFLISGVMAINKSEYVYLLSIWFGYITYTFLLRYLRADDKKYFQKYLYFLGVVSFLPALYGVFQYFGLDINWNLKTNFRIISTFGNPNAFTQFIVIALPFHLLLRKKIFAAFALIDGFSLFLANSRAGLVILIIDAVILLFFYLPKKKILILIVLGIVLLFNISKVKRFRVDEIRVLIYRSSIEMIKNNPILGVGLGNYKINYPLYRTEKEHYSYSGASTMVAKAHNIFIEYGAEGGLPALALLLLYLLVVWRKGKNLFYHIAILNFILDGLVSFNYLNTAAMFLFFTVIVTADNAKKMRSLKIPKYAEIGIGIILILFAIFQIKYYSSEVIYTQASRLEHQKKYSAAVVWANRSAKFDKNYYDSFSKAGFLYWSKLGNYFRAILEFRKYLRYSPYNSSILQDIGFSYDHLKNRIYSIYFYRKTLLIDPYYPEAVGNLANAYFDMHNYELAKIMYLRIIKMGLHSIAAYNNLGNTYQALGRYELARKMYRTVLQIDKNVFQTQYNLSYIDYKLGRLDEARNHIILAQQLSPNSKFVSNLYEHIQMKIYNSVK